MQALKTSSTKHHHLTTMADREVDIKFKTTGAGKAAGDAKKLAQEVREIIEGGSDG